MFDKLSAMEALPFFNRLTEEQLSKLHDEAEIRHFKKGDEISALTENCVGPFLILTGSVRAVWENDNFREVTLFKLYPYEIGILSAACVLEWITFETKFVAEEETAILALKSCVFRKVIEDNLLIRCAVFEIIADRFSSCMSTLQELLFTKYEKRVAAFLLEQYTYTGSPELAITQEELAKNTGSAREVAGRTIRRFAEDGLVEYSRGKIIIVNARKLKDITT